MWVLLASVRLILFGLVILVTWPFSAVHEWAGRQVR